MFSSEKLQQIPYFSKLNEEQVECLLGASLLRTANRGEFLFHRGDFLHHFYLVETGEFEIIFESPKLSVEYESHGQPSQLETEQVRLSRVAPGQIMGWSGLVPPHQATSGGRALQTSKIIAFDCQKLLQYFEQDCNFGFLMMQTAALVIGLRLQDIYKGGAE